MKSYDTSFGKIKVKKNGAVSLEIDTEFQITALPEELVQQLATVHLLDAYREVATALTKETITLMVTRDLSTLEKELNVIFENILRELK